jgi:hypothetical protein
MFQHGPSPLPGPVSRGWPSASARPADDAREDRPIRTELVERVRREIAAGTYDTEEKFEKALDKLLQRLEEDL